MKQFLPFLIILFFACNDPHETGNGYKVISDNSNHSNSSVSFTVIPTAWDSSGHGIYKYDLRHLVDLDNFDKDIVIMCVSLSDSNWCGMPVHSFLTSGDNVEFSYSKNKACLYYFNTNGHPLMPVHFKISVIYGD